MLWVDDDRFAIVIYLIDRLHENGSWCGETHIQKAAFVGDAVFRLCLGHKFLFYKHGPFSFDLRSDLTAMKAANIISLRVRHEGYGPSYEVTDFGRRFSNRLSENIQSVKEPLDQVCAWLGDKDVRELEKLSSAIFFTRPDKSETISVRANRIVDAKPHISLKEAEEAIETVDIKCQEILSIVKYHRKTQVS